MPRSGYRYYAVAVGYETGVFNYWCEAKDATDGYPRAKFQGFNNLAEAWEYVARGGAYSKRAWAEIRTIPESYGPYQNAYNYYAVAVGFRTGVFGNWGDARDATDGYPRARFQGCNNLAEAWEYVARGGAYSKRDWAEIRTTPESYGPYQNAYNYYAVAVGFRTGVFGNWGDARDATDGYPRARFQGCNNLAEAWEYVARGGAYSKRDWAEIRTTPGDN